MSIFEFDLDYWPAFDNIEDLLIIFLLKIKGLKGKMILYYFYFSLRNKL